MQTWVYVNKEGEKYRVVHRNKSLMMWDHTYAEKNSCDACLGKSEAAPKDDVHRTPTEGGESTRKEV